MRSFRWCVFSVVLAVSPLVDALAPLASMVVLLPAASTLFSRLAFVQVPDGEDPTIDVSSLDAIYSVQKMAEVLVLGPDSEREFILFELQQLLDHCLEDTMKILIPVLCQHVPNWNIDLQIKAAQRLYDVVSLELEPSVANMITCASFGVIHRSKGCAAPEYEDLYNLWGGLLVDCLPNMEWSAQEIKDVLTLVDIHSKESYTSRKVAARVIGALALCLDKAKVEKIILPRALQLFDDTDVEVRGTVVESLANIGAALHIRITETVVWPKIEKLLEPPEEARIRATAMRTMAHILEAHRSSPGQSRLFRELLPPVFNRLAIFAKKFSAEDQRLVQDDTYLLLEVVSEVFGQFVYSLSLVTKKTFRKEAYKAYAGMATCNGPLIRRNCAFNLPGVAKALGDRYALELSGLCDYLANDMDEQVRWILAAGIHETAALLAPRGNFERLFGAVCALLQDESPMVRMNALTHFHDLLTAFAKDGSDPASLRRLAPVFSDLTMLSEGEWRIQKSLAEQLGRCADIIPPDSLMDNVLPLLYRLTKQGTPLVREAAMNATARSLRKIPIRDRKIALEKYWRAAATGPFWMRLALLDGGAAAMKVFSHKGFSELFAGDMLRLAVDPVPNVRIRIASLMAKMAPMCADMIIYEKALDALQKDKDQDVVEIMKRHNESARLAMKEARERLNHDSLKYKEEQEFYGQSKPQKRARGRGAQAKGNHRIIIPGRRPSLEHSTAGDLPVSSEIVAAAKATSLQASEMKPGYQVRRMAEIDNAAAYLGTADEMNSRPGGGGGGAADSVHVEGEGVVDDHLISVHDPGVGATSSAMNMGHGQIVKTGGTSVEIDRGGGVDNYGNGVMMVDVSGGANGPDDRTTASGPGNGRPGSGTGVMNGNVPVQRTSGSAGRYESRSKSWNGIIAQLPRQLSMESRTRRNAAKNGSVDGVVAAANNGKGNQSAWARMNKENGPKRKLSSLRTKKKKMGGGRNGSGVGGVSNAGGDDSNVSEASISTDVTDMSADVVENSSANAGSGGGGNGTLSGRAIAARAKSMVHPGSMDVDDGNDGGFAPTVGMTDVSSIPGGVDGGMDGGLRKGILLGKGRKKGNGNMDQGGSVGPMVTVSYEKDSGLPSFKGSAPWLRPKNEDEDVDALSKAVQQMEYESGGGRGGAEMNGGGGGRVSKESMMMARPGMEGNVGGGGSAMSEFSIVPGGGPDGGSTNVSVDGGGANVNGNMGGNGRRFRGLFRRRR